jgi:transposase
MEQLKQVLQLQKDGIPIREIARRVGISRNSVRKYLSRLKVCEGPTDSDLAVTAYNNDLLELEAERLQQVTAHFNAASKDLGNTGVTRQLLWKEYRAQHPDGYSYSRYCYHLKQYRKNQDLAMHLEYTPADMTMIDYAGKKMHYVDLSTGERLACEVFIAILPFSGLIFCHPEHTQQTADFARSINSMVKFYGGVTATILGDNLATAVKRADRYEPQFTDICLQLSEHYQTTFSATRPRSPRDKAMVEKAVNIAYNHIYGPLRNREFTSLAALRAAMLEQLAILNDKPYKNTPYSRRYIFEQQERHLLKVLPGEPFGIKKVVFHTVQRNYHVQLTEDRRYYSVPYRYVGKKVKVLYDAQVLEVYLDQERIALHYRKQLQQSAYITLDEHMPPHHGRMKEIKGLNRDDLLMMASRIGPFTQQAAAAILQNSVYMEQNYKSCFGMLMLQKKYTAVRLEAACSRILMGTRVNYTLIKNILQRGLDKQQSLLLPSAIPDHDNIRGKDNYQ